jgi:transposase
VLVENFDLVKSDKVEKSEILHLYFEEKSDFPSEFQHFKLYSKGFFPETSIQDFPLRGFKVYLHVKRRRWIDTACEEVKTRNWSLVANGTRMTQ